MAPVIDVTTLDTLGLWVLGFDRELCPVLWNDVAAQESGYSAQQILTGTALWGQLFPEELRARAEAILTGAVARHEQEVTHLLADGQGCTVSWRAGLWPDAEPGPGLLFIGHDVTAQRQKLERAHNEASRYRSLIDASPDAITIYDLQGNLIAANREAARHYGLDSGEEFVARVKTIFGLLDDAGRAQAAANFSHTLEHGVSQRNEYCVLLPDGRKMDAEINSAPVNSPDGTPTAFISIVRDVTERKRMERALRESEHSLRTLFDSLPQLIAHVDRSLRYRFANRAHEGPLGFPAADLVGHPVSDVLGQAMADFQLHIDRALAGEIVHFEQSSTFNGAPWTVLGVMVPDSDDHEHCGLYVVFTDVSELREATAERERLQAQLQQAMKMEAIGRLAGGVAHDFNNLLTGIMGNVHLARLDLVSGDPIAQNLEEIQQAADSAAALTGQLLAFSRKQIIEPRVVNLNDLIERMHRMLHRMIGEDIQLETITPPGIWSVKVDPGQLEQVVVNLAVNARDAMPAGGRLVVETANTELDPDYCRRHSYVQPGEYVMLAISDTGTGIAHEVLPHLFEPFFTTKPKGVGTGLGLATIYGAVKQAGGSIEVYSEVDRGTTFKIYLPRTAGAPTALHRPAWTNLPGGGETILLVEDSRVVRDPTHRLLQQLGYRLLTAESGDQALQLLAEFGEPVNLLITDVVMPGMNGRELATEVTRRHPETAVLYTSGYTENIIVHHGVLEDGLQFLGKPYSFRALATRIRQILDP